MAKYENIRALAKKQLQAVTESSDRWKAFLRTAAIAYNYSFPNQLLIHEQSPTATAVADIAYWNNNAGRWVKRGAHGIAVFDTRANSSRLRYLFDISDTIPRAEIPDALPWVITDQNWRPVWDKIVADNHADSIQSALLMLSTSCVAQRSAMFTTALGKAIDGSSLQWAKPDEQRQLFIQLITQSCLYMAALRCGVDTARLDLSALESVNQFDTNRIALCLGSACQQAARPLMQQIGSITREIDSVARAEKVRYYGDKQEETNNTKEVNNGVHDGERLPNPGADVERAADAGNREVRQPAAEIPAGERPDGVRRDDAGGNAVPASGGDGQRSTPANRTDDADADAAEHRPEPADRPDGLDAVDERLAGPSRGTGDAADLQPVIQEPQAESDTTPSAFSVPISDLPPLSDELILGLLAKESSSRADNAAILEYFNEHPDLAERSAFCKHCYKQIYTYLFVDDHTVGFIRHDMYLELWEGNYLTKTAQVNLTWDAVAAKIADLIEQGRLMVPIKATPVQQQMEQLTLTPEDSEKAGLPSREQQAKNIDLAAEAKKWNKPIIDASGKYITEQDITDALCKGGGFEDSKFRIQQYFSAQVLPIEEDQARWLKKEYGIGGGTWFFRDGGHGFLDHMGKNLEITRHTEDGEYRRVLKWKEIAQRLRLLVYNDQYLTDAEKATYQAWAAEQQAARAANDAALDHAKHAITDFCENEGLNEPNFSDLTRVEFAYSTTEDDEHEIQVYANLLRNEIRYEIDGNIVHIDYFQDIGAVRLPNNAFKGSGTKIMTDVIFLQKRDTLRQQDEPWLHLAEDANGITMNRYFVEHPDMICGKMEIVSGPYGPTPTCQPIDPDAVDRFGKPLLETQIDTAMQHLTATLTKAEISVQEESGEDTKYIDADPFVRNFSYTVKDDKIYYREGAVMRECNPNAASAERIRKLVELRDTTRALIDAQLQDLSDEEIHRLQAQLNRQYDAFRAKHGLINSRSSELSFRDDSSYYLLCSLENVDEKGNFISKSDMFTKRTIRSAQIPDHADTASDALALSIGERAKVDMPYMMHLTGKDEATLAKELAGVIFVEPFRKQEDGSSVYLMADEYLSGNVREKLRIAHVAADQDPAFRINVEALEQVQPKDLTAGEITVRLGVTWIGSEIIKQFADELFQSTYREQKIAVRYNEYLNNWYISNKSQGNDNIRVTNTYGTKRINGYHLLENALNLRATKIYDTIYDENGKEQHKLNGPATEEAQAKQRMIEDAFKDWIFKDRERRESLVALYNEKFNCIRPREYDGSHIQFFGMNPEIALRPHQRNAIAHILYGHNTLLAHVVGAGKSATRSQLKKLRAGQLV